MFKRFFYYLLTFSTISSLLLFCACQSKPFFEDETWIPVVKNITTSENLENSENSDTTLGNVRSPNVSSAAQDTKSTETTETTKTSTTASELKPYVFGDIAFLEIADMSLVLGKAAYEGADYITSAAVLADSLTAEDEKAPIVFVSLTGKGSKFHSITFCSSIKNVVACTISEAENAGYSSCSKC